MPWNESFSGWLFYSALLSCRSLGPWQRRRTAVPSAGAAAANYRTRPGRLPRRSVAGHDSRVSAVEPSPGDTPRRPAAGNRRCRRQRRRKSSRWCPRRTSRRKRLPTCHRTDNRRAGHRRRPARGISVGGSSGCTCWGWRSASHGGCWAWLRSGESSGRRGLRPPLPATVGRDCRPAHERVRMLTSRLAKQPFATLRLAVPLPPRRAAWHRALIVLPGKHV